MPPVIYQNNDDLRGKGGTWLYAREHLWRDGRSSTQPPTIKWNTKVEGLLYDDLGDIVFRYRGQYYVAQRSLFSDLPLDTPPPPADSLTVTATKG